MIASMANYVPKLTLTSCDNKHKVTSIAMFFVDNTRLSASAMCPPTSFPQELISSATVNIQYLAQHWECLLFSMGGAINFQKRAWVLLAWNWTGGLPKLATITQMPADLYLTEDDSLGDPIKVPRLESTDTFRTLGVSYLTLRLLGCRFQYSLTKIC